MTTQSIESMLIELRQFDTPSITNVVATYPGAATCLTAWFTGSSLKLLSLNAAEKSASMSS